MIFSHPNIPAAVPQTIVVELLSIIKVADLELVSVEKAPVERTTHVKEAWKVKFSNGKSLTIFEGLTPTYNRSFVFVEYNSVLINISLAPEKLKLMQVIGD